MEKIKFSLIILSIFGLLAYNDHPGIMMNDRHALIRLSDVLMIVSLAAVTVSAPLQGLFYVPLGLSLLFSALDRLLRGSEASRPRTFVKTDVLPAVFIGIALAGAWTARYHLAALEGVAVGMLYMAVFVYARSYPMDERRYRMMAGGAAFGLGVSGAFALIHFFLVRSAIRLTLPVMGSLVIPSSDGAGGLVSVFLDPVSGGLVLSFLVVFLAGHLLGRDDIRIREWIFDLAVIVIGLAALYWIRSWGAYVFLLSAVSVLLILYRKTILLVLPVAFAVLIVLTQGLSAVKNPLDPFASPAWKGRMLQYGTGLDVLVERNPIWGIGLGNFRYAYFESEYTNADFEREKGQAVVTNGPVREFLGIKEYRIRNMPVLSQQNAFLSLLTETGVTGLLMLALFWIGIAWSGLRDFRRQRDPVSALSFAVLSGFFVHSLFWNMLYVVPVSVLVWWLAGLSRNRTLKEQWRIRTDHE